MARSKLRPHSSLLTSVSALALLGGCGAGPSEEPGPGGETTPEVITPPVTPTPGTPGGPTVDIVKTWTFTRTSFTLKGEAFPATSYWQCIGGGSGQNLDVLLGYQLAL